MENGLKLSRIMADADKLFDETTERPWPFASANRIAQQGNHIGCPILNGFLA